MLANNCSSSLTGIEGDQQDNDCDELVDEEICDNDLGKSSTPIW